MRGQRPNDEFVLRARPLPDLAGVLLGSCPAHRRPQELLERDGLRRMTGAWVGPFWSMSPRRPVHEENGAYPREAIGPGSKHAGARTTAPVPSPDRVTC